MKKTGSTPIVEEGVGGGEVLGALEVRTILVHFKDGHGQEATKLAIVIPGGDTYFLDKNAIDLRPVQRWLRDAMLKKVSNG